MNARHIQPLLSTVFAAAFVGCASHTAKLAQVKTDIAMPGYAVNTGAVPFRPEDVNGPDKILNLAERARAYQLTGEIDKSTEDYLAAEAAYDVLDDSAIVSVSKETSKAVVGVLANDTALPYEGNAHERLMLYQLDAFNHLARLDWNNTRAAANNIVYLSERERQRREAKIREAEELQKEGHKGHRFAYSSLTGTPLFKSKFAASYAAAKAFTDALQNGYAYYFGAFVREVDGDYSGARLGYQRAAELAPANAFVKRDIARMDAAVDGGSVPGPEPNVLVFFEEGFAPQLDSFSLSFLTIPVGGHESIAGARVAAGSNGGVVAGAMPTSHPLSVKFTLPFYSQEQLGVPSYPLVVSEGGAGVVAETQLVGDFRALAARAFEDRLPYIATRSAYRAITKAVAAAVVNNVVAKRSSIPFAGVLAKAGGILLTQATEFADLRTWLLAPRFGQIARWHANPGRHGFTFQHAGNSKTVVAEVPADGTLVFHVVSVPGRMVVEGTAVEP